MTAVAKLPEKWRAEADMYEAEHNNQHGYVIEWESHGKAIALERAADELEAALSPAELGGVEDYVDPLDVFLSQGVDDVPCLQVPGRVLARFIPGSWDCAYEMFSGNTPTPRAAEAVTEAELAEVIQRHTGCADSDSIYAAVAVLQALTPPSAKGE